MPYRGLFFSQFVRGKWSKRFYFVFVNYLYLLVILFMFYHFGKLSPLTYFFPMVCAQHVRLNWGFCNSVRLFPFVSCLLSMFGIPSLWKNWWQVIMRWGFFCFSFFSRLVYFFNSKMNHWNNKLTNQLCVCWRELQYICVEKWVDPHIASQICHTYNLLFSMHSAWGYMYCICSTVSTACRRWSWGLCCSGAWAVQLSPFNTRSWSECVFNFCIVWIAKLLDSVSVETVAEQCAIQPLI